MLRRRAKIICTIGPASASPRVIRGLLGAGMDVARLNFSHGDYPFHETAFKTLRREAARAADRKKKKALRPLAVMQDLQGIKMRVGAITGGAMELKKGAIVSVFAGEGPGAGGSIYINYPSLVRATPEGARILLDDGLLELEVIEKRRALLVAKVKTGGPLAQRKGVNIPGLKPLEVSFTEKDARDLRFGLKMGVDWVALSYVKRAEDVEALRGFLKKAGAGKAQPSVIAKIETPQALENIEDILALADGIMVARGDLGIEIPPEDVPLVQKSLIGKANRAGRLVIVATEMLESMTVQRRPTRAEATDVSNAVIEGADALMLSQETSIGKYPVEAVAMMERIIERAERAGILPKSRYQNRATFSDAVARAAAGAAETAGARYIVAFTQSGYTARLISMLRPSVDIIAMSPSKRVEARMALYWGVSPLAVPMPASTDELFREVERELAGRKLVKKGDIIAITGGTPLKKRGKTNMLKLHVVGE